MKLWKSKKPIGGCVPGKSAALKQDQQQDTHGSFGTQQQQQTDSNGIALAPMLSGKKNKLFLLFLKTPKKKVKKIICGAPNMCAPIFLFSAFPPPSAAAAPPRSGLSHFRSRCLRTALKCSVLDIDLYTKYPVVCAIFQSKVSKYPSI